MKMRNILYIFFTLLLLTCDSENANDCFQTSGKIIQQEIDISSFESILVNRDIELIIEEGIDFSVLVETGENLLNDIEALVVDNQLRLKDNNTCNYVRDYGITKVFVSAPDLKSIRTSSQYEVSSNGVLNFSNITLYSEDFNTPGTFTVGDFRLQINSSELRIISNNISSFYISGEVEDLYVGFFSGAGRFEGKDLNAQNVTVSHRGSNDMLVNPQVSLSGVLRGTGDLLSFNNPDIVEVEQLYTGRLIFQN